MDQERIGNFIKEIRVDNNLTQRELADKLGVTYQAVSKWENGKNIPDIQTLKQISKEFNIDINDLLDGEESFKIKKKENITSNLKLIVILLLIPIVTALIVISITKQNNDFEFKTITTTCEDFKITGSAAYNKEKATIYISSIEFCGKEDTNKYKNITCTLYEVNKNTKTKISDCEKKKNVNLEEFLKDVNIKVNHFSKSCKDLNKNNLLLEINATNSDMKKITYTIPIKLNDTCLH